MTLPELIASEVMNVIEREQRINKDDLITAAKVAIMKHDAEALSSHPVVTTATTTKSMEEAVDEYRRLDAWEIPSHTHRFTD